MAKQTSNIIEGDDPMLFFEITVSNIPIYMDQATEIIW